MAAILSRPQCVKQLGIFCVHEMQLIFFMNKTIQYNEYSIITVDTDGPSASVAAVLSMQPYIYSCLWVKWCYVNAIFYIKSNFSILLSFISLSFITPADGPAPVLQEWCWSLGLHTYKPDCLSQIWGFPC